MIVGNQTYEALFWAGLQRMQSGYRPKTLAAQNTHFTTFIQFLELINQSMEDIGHITVIAFIELLTANGVRHYSSIINYLSSIKARCRLYRLAVGVFTHE